MHLKLLEKQEQTKSKTRNRENNKYQGQDTKQSIQRINETQSWFFEKINKVDKPLVNMTE
jgi:hypothetical protein